MTRKMTWEEMKSAFPNEWLLITEYEVDEYGKVKTGIVERHSTDDSVVFGLPSSEKDCAFRYTGKSTFPGGLRAHAKDHKV
ncbi:MAG: hypothetical protein CO021_06070 [Deltaproteobacteria bacterium CG_4_9_14_0_2_um_filter_42_21]|nr:MAG: hypothetical protein CO021_06070 [Deltaproteobacteria bacterium CG_4_9_14_0_2_um_filter_42_21]